MSKPVSSTFDSLPAASVPAFRTAYNLGDTSKFGMDFMVDDICPETGKNLGRVPELSLTKQSFVEECDYNRILANASLTGSIHHVNAMAPRFIDCSDYPDFHTAMNVVTQAHQEFAELPSGIREFFKNDPSNMLDFLGDSANRDKAVELGLIAPKEAPSGTPPQSKPEGGSVGVVSAPTGGEVKGQS